MAFQYLSDLSLHWPESTIRLKSEKVRGDSMKNEIPNFHIYSRFIIALGTTLEEEEASCEIPC